MAVRRRKLTRGVALLWCLGLLAVLGVVAEGARADLEAALTISVDRPARVVRGKLVGDSVYWHACWGDGQAHVKIRRVEPGHDKLVAEDQYTDYEGNWEARIRPAAVKGKRIYAEVPGFNICAAARSRIVKAP